MWCYAITFVVGLFAGTIVGWTCCSLCWQAKCSDCELLMKDI